MGVAADELFVEAASDVVDVELAGVRGDLRVKDDLLEDIAELLAQMGLVMGIDGVDRLVCLLDHVLRY